MRESEWRGVGEAGWVVALVGVGGGCGRAGHWWWPDWLTGEHGPVTHF